jgi:hypothetical protein
VQREEYGLPPASAILSSEKRQRLKFVEMDGLGIVYLIENAQQFWSGALSPTRHLQALLLTLIFRARGHS